VTGAARDSSLRIVVSGLLAQYPLGGVSWDYLQYPVGLHRAGHDVFYVEDTGLWPYDPEQDGVSKTCDRNVRHLEDLMARFGLEDRWAYCFPWRNQWFGVSESRRREILATADLVLNVSGVLRRPDRLERRGVLAYIDSDPVFTQVKLARGQNDFVSMVDAHDRHFSFGESLPGRAPTTDHEWLPTRQPVLLDEWRHELPDGPSYTTVMNWTSYRPVEFGGVRYGQKDEELRRFMDLPRHVDVPLELALASGKTARAPVELLRHRGWKVVNPGVACPDLDAYRAYLQRSRGEWSVAKHGYVVGRAGWFSCRSACYLAAGRPVVVEDTGFDAVLPVGDGLLAFSTLEEAVDALEQVESKYEHHARAARTIAEEYFDADRVLASLVERAMAAAR
jgi:hypothetical protein